MKNAFRVFFISSSRFAGSRWKKLLKFKFSAPFHGLRNSVVCVTALTASFRFFSRFQSTWSEKQSKLCWKQCVVVIVIACWQAREGLEIRFCVNRHMNKGRWIRSPNFLLSDPVLKLDRNLQVLGNLANDLSDGLERAVKKRNKSSTLLPVFFLLYLR